MANSPFIPRPSGVSLLSSYASTEYTTSGSSSSTVPGLGAITGKVLKALGTVTLRGIEHVVITRHLLAIAYAFPHTDGDALHLRNVDGIYDDLLEFSRPGMYRNEIRNKALGYILRQIGMSETRHLISALSRWHAVETHILLSEILVQTKPLWKPHSKPILSTPLFNSYTGAQPWSRVSPVPLILFFSKLIRTNHTICRTVLDVGFLDVLLAMSHAYDFSGYNDRQSISQPPLHPHGQLIIACNAALLDVAAYLEYRELLSCHSITRLWPGGHAAVYNPPSLPFTTRRKVLLLGVEDDVSVLDSYSPYFSISLRSICSQPCISTLQPKTLLHSLTFGVTHDQALRVYLSQSTHGERVTLLTKLLRCMPISTIPIASDPDALDGPSRRYQLLFCLHLIGVISQTMPGGRPALIRAGVIEYLVRVLHTEFPDSYFAHITALTDISDIPRTIRESPLPDLVRDHGGTSTRMQRAIQGAFSALFPSSANPNFHWNNRSYIKKADDPAL